MHPDSHLQIADDYIAVHDFAPSGPADTELEWFFTMAESDMGARSNFGAMVGERPPDTAESRAQAARAQRTILEFLKQVGDPHAGVLHVAYDALPWPPVLRETLDRVTGVVVRLGSAQRELPDDTPSRRALDLRTANQFAGMLARSERTALAAFELRGRILLRGAFLAYERTRGGPRRPVVLGVSQ